MMGETALIRSCESGSHTLTVQLHRAAYCVLLPEYQDKLSPDSTTFQGRTSIKLTITLRHTAFIHTVQ